MKLHEIDILIICAYLIAMIVIGLILKKRAAQNMDSYFLGGKSLRRRQQLLKESALSLI